MADIPKASFDEEIPTAQFDTASFADEPAQADLSAKRPLTLPGKVKEKTVGFVEDFGDKLTGALKEETRNSRDRIKQAKSPIDTKDIGSPALAGALADLVVGTVGLPISWFAASEHYKKTLNKEDTLALLETTKEWFSARKLTSYYGEKLGVDPKTLEKTLYADNFLDSIFKHIDDGLETAAKTLGIKDELGKHAFKDATMVGVPLLAGRMLRPKTARTTPEKDVKEIRQERKAAQDRDAMVNAKQEELFPAKGEQQEMQFGKPPEARFADEVVPEREAIDQQFNSEQGAFAFEPQKGQTPDMFAPLNQQRDVSLEQAKNPYLDESTIRQQEQGLEFDKLPPNEPEPLPNIGTVNDKTGGLEQAGLPFKATGQLWTAEGKRVPLGQIKKGQGGWVKLPGGNWHPQVKDFFTKYLFSRFTPAHEANPIIKSNIDRILTNYINKYLGTERDPLRTIQLPMFDNRTWEQLIDNMLFPRQAELYADRIDAAFKDLNKLGKEKPDATVWKIDDVANKTWPGDVLNDFYDFLSHVGDYLRNHVAPEDLPRYDFPRLVRETLEQDRRQVKAMEKARADTSGTTVHKEYPDGMKWVEVGKSDTIPKNYTVQENISIDRERPYSVFKDGEIVKDLENTKTGYNEFRTQQAAENALKEYLENNALKNEGDMMGHCVGGYCEAVRQGASRIFSLRDSKNNSHVTIEAQPRVTTQPRTWEGFKSIFNDALDIVQIKGKQNAKPVDKYIPYVQDFVKSNKMDVIRDLENADLFSNLSKDGSFWPEEISYGLRENKYLGLHPEALQKYLPDTGPYYTKAEMIEAAEKWYHDHGTKYLRTFGAMSPEEAAKAGSLLPRIFGSSPESVKKKIDSLVSPYTSQADIIAEAKSGMLKEKDFDYLDLYNVKTTTGNQVPAIARRPSVTYHVDKIREANISKATLAHELAPLVEEFEKMGPLSSQTKVLDIAVELQKQKWQDTMKARGHGVTDAELTKLGLSEEEIGMFRQIRKINDRLWEITVEARKRLDGTDMGKSPVMDYHPRSYGIGDHVVVLYDKKTGAVERMHRYQDYDEMVKDYQVLKKEVDKDGTFELAYRAGAKDWDNPFTNISMNTVPKVIQDILASIEMKIETRKRTFEIDRVKHDIKGLIQKLADGSPDPMLKDVWVSAIKNVIEFDKRSKVFEAQKELLENKEYFDDKPLMQDYLQKLLQAELGHEITWLPFKGIHKAADSVTNTYQRIKRRISGKELLDKEGKDKLISKDAARDAAKFASATASSATLLFNIPNMVTNALQMPLTGIVGLPLDALGRLRGSPSQVLKWTAEANLELSQALNELAYTKATGKPTRASQILDKYNKQGQVKSHMFDEITEVAESTRPSLKREIGKVAQVGRKWTNDLFIESPTNAVSLLYYDILVNQVARSHLEKAGVSPKQMKELPIVLSKSWTAEYNRWARPMYLQQMGIIGDTTSNFSHWSHNQWGKFVEALGEVKPENGKGLAQGLGYTLAFWYAYAQLAGGKNSPVLNTFDTVRQWYNSNKDRDEDAIPDMDYYNLELGLPSWLYPTNPLLDNTGIDLSSSQRFAPPIQMSTITFQFWASMAKTTGLVLEALGDNYTNWKSDPTSTSPKGITRSEILDSTSKLPSILRHGVIEPKWATLPRPDGSKAVVNKYENLSYTQKDNKEEWLNNLGFKSTRQKKESQQIQHNRITKERLSNEPKRLKEHIIQQMTDYLVDPEESFTTEAIIKENILRLTALDKDWAGKQGKQFQQDLATRYKKLLQTPEEQIKSEIKPHTKASKLKRLIEMFNRL